ncbi:MAG: MGMT family protein [Candidatus Aminicenantes bacterium]|nr:MAG: MGMT family protein [Candidatus Aminicenantes bacterium]
MSENTEDTSKIVITSEIIRLIKAIPRGKVATYGQIACLTGLYTSVRRVVWILHSCSKKERLPWHRVVNRQGAISLKRGAGYEKQKEMLKREGIVFDEKDRIDLERYLWEPDEEDII